MIWILMVACSCNGSPKLDAAEAEIDALRDENRELRLENEDLLAKLEALERELARLQRLLAEADGVELDALPEGDTDEQPDPTEEVDRSADARAPNPTGQHCIKGSGGRYRLSAGVQANDITASVRLRPWLDEDGVADGLRVSGIQPGSLADTCGFKNGDIVHEVDGVTVTSFEEGLEMYEELVGASSVEFVVTRRGRSQTWVVDGPR